MFALSILHVGLALLGPPLVLALPIQDAGGPPPNPLEPADSAVWSLDVETMVDPGNLENFVPDLLIGVGDANGDGRGDLLVGSQFEGRVELRSGRDGELLWSREDDPATAFGLTIAAAGDVDQDGRADVIVSSPFWGTPIEGLFIGRVQVFSGRSGKLLSELRGGVAGEFFGYSVQGVGDLDDDGVPELAVGIPADDHVQVFSGKDHTLLYDLRSDSDALVGLHVDEAGDVDGDGSTDLLIGLLTPVGNKLTRGALVISGRTGEELFTLEGSLVVGQLDFGLAAPGDVNQDGYADILMLRQGAGAGFGQPELFAGPDGAPLPLPFPTDLPEVLDVSGAGDLDGDGHPDIALATRSFITGGLRVVSGRTGVTLLKRTFPGHPAATQHASVVAGGDVNGDGFGETLIVLHQFPSSFTKSRAHVVFGGDPWQLRPGDRLRDSLPAGGVDRAWIPLVMGAKVDLRMTAHQKSDVQPWLRLLAPSGELVGDHGHVGLARIQLDAVPETGLYEVQLRDSGQAGGAYQLKTRARFPKGQGLVLSPSAIGDTPTVLAGQRVAGDVVGAEPVTALIDLVAGAKLSLRVRSSNGSALRPAIVIADPGGRQIAGALPAVGETVDRVRKLVVNRTGTYTISIFGDEDSTGEFVLRTKARVARGKARIESTTSRDLSADR
jgi:hypothetical protein